MKLDLSNSLFNNVKEHSFVKNFIKELSKVVEDFNNKNEFEGDKMDDIELTEKEDLEFYRGKFKFLKEYFKEELLDLSKGEIFIVTNKYENDYEYHRYKVTQYKDNKECKYIAFEKDLPPNVQLGDVVRKVNGKYIYDEQATRICKRFYKQN